MPDYSHVKSKVPSHIVPAAHSHDNHSHGKQGHTNHHNHSHKHETHAHDNSHEHGHQVPPAVYGHGHQNLQHGQRPTMSINDFLAKHDNDELVEPVEPATTTNTIITNTSNTSESAPSDASDVHHARHDHEHDTHADLARGHHDTRAVVATTTAAVDAAKKTAPKKRRGSVRRASIKDTKAGVNVANAKMTKKKVATRMSDQEAREVHRSTRMTVHSALAGVLGGMMGGNTPQTNDDGSAEGETPNSSTSVNLLTSPYVEREARRQSIINIQNKAEGGRVPFDSNVISVSDPVRVQLERKLTIVESPETDLSGIVASYRNAIDQTPHEGSDED